MGHEVAQPMEPYWAFLLSADTLFVLVALALVGQYLAAWPAIRASAARAKPVLLAYAFVVPVSSGCMGLAWLVFVRCEGLAERLGVEGVGAAGLAAVWGLPVVLALVGAFELSTMHTGAVAPARERGQLPPQPGLLGVHWRSAVERLAVGVLIAIGVVLVYGQESGLAAFAVMSVVAAGVVPRGVRRWVGRRAHLLKLKPILSRGALCGAFLAVLGLWALSLSLQAGIIWRGLVAEATALWATSLVSTVFNIGMGAIAIVASRVGSFREVLGVSAIAGSVPAEVIATVGRTTIDADLCALGSVASLLLSFIALLGALAAASAIRSERAESSEAVGRPPSAQPYEPRARPHGRRGLGRVASIVRGALPTAFVSAGVVALVCVIGLGVIRLGPRFPRFELPLSRQLMATLAILALIAIGDALSRIDRRRSATPTEREWAWRIARALADLSGEAHESAIAARLGLASCPESSRIIQRGGDLLSEWRVAVQQREWYYLLPRGRLVLS